MEIELKYLIPDKDIIDELWKESVFEKYGDVDSRAQIEMKAVYYDTEERSLGSVGAAFRIRHEGVRTVATLKWDGKQDESLHEREELNIPLAEPPEDGKTSLDCFAESEKGRELIELVGDRPLIEMMRTDFVRRTMRIDTGVTICELALDVGLIITEAGNLDICEFEIELFSGRTEDIVEIGSDLAERFGLTEGTVSKYGRGLELLQKNRKKGI